MEKIIGKRGCIPWFTQEANKVSRQETCTIYVRPQVPSRSPEGVETQKRLPVQVLETQAKLVDTVSLCVPGGNSA